MSTETTTVTVGEATTVSVTAATGPRGVTSWLQTVYDVASITHEVGITVALTINAGFGGVETFNTPGTYEAGTDWTAAGSLDQIAVSGRIITNDANDPLSGSSVAVESNMGAPMDFGGTFWTYKYPNGIYRIVLNAYPTSLHWGVRAFADVIIDDAVDPRVETVIIHPDQEYTYDAVMATYQRHVYPDGTVGTHFDAAGDSPALVGLLSLERPDPGRFHQFWFGMNRVDPR